MRFLLVLTVCALFAKVLAVDRALNRVFILESAHGEFNLPGTNVSVVYGTTEPSSFKTETHRSSLPAYVVRARSAEAIQQIEGLSALGAIVDRIADEYFVVRVSTAMTDFAERTYLTQKMLLVADQKTEQRVSFTASSGDNPAKEALINSLNPTPYRTTLSQLTGATSFMLRGQPVTTRTRYSTTTSCQQSGEWQSELFKGYGFNEVILQPFVVSGVTTNNVIAVKTGTKFPDEIIVIGAHYDSTSQSPQTLAPGAVDNGSGSAAVHLLAQAIGQMSFERTVHMVTFSGEEQGLVGSTHYVRQMAGKKIIAAIIMDMIAYSNRFFGVMIEGTTNSAIQALMNLCETNIRAYGTRLTIKRSNNSFGSDHVPFQRAGIPAILLIEEDDTNYPHYHRSTDTIEHCNIDQCMAIARGMTGAFWDLANPTASSKQ